MKSWCVWLMSAVMLAGHAWADAGDTHLTITEQKVSALPKELYEGWWITYDRLMNMSYALRFEVKDGKIQGEHHGFWCQQGGAFIDDDRASFTLTPTAKQGFDMRYDNPEYVRSYLNFLAIKPSTALITRQDFADDELAEMFPRGINWIYLYSDTPTPKCPKR